MNRYCNPNLSLKKLILTLAVTKFLLNTNFSMEPNADLSCYWSKFCGNSMNVTEFTWTECYWNPNFCNGLISSELLLIHDSWQILWNVLKSECFAGFLGMDRVWIRARHPFPLCLPCYSTPVKSEKPSSCCSALFFCQLDSDTSVDNNLSKFLWSIATCWSPSSLLVAPLWCLCR